MGKVGEWFWRFLAAVMLFAVCWMLWIFHHLNPTPLVLPAAFDAAAKAGAKQNAQGVIMPAMAKEPEVKEQREAKEPPVDMEKLKLTNSLSEAVAEKAPQARK
jgi:hypothetical protein